MATGKRRVALLGLAFKPGTDDLRESPLLELAERLLGKGFELRIHDPAVQLSALHGSNRAFLEERLPHIDRLLCERARGRRGAAEVVVIGHGAAAFAQRRGVACAGQGRRAAGMNVLVLSSRPPWPPTRADQMTVDALVRFLAGRGAAVDLACFVESEAEDRRCARSSGACAGASRRCRCRAGAPTPTRRSRCPAAPRCRWPTTAPRRCTGCVARARRGRERYDLVYVHLIRMAEYARRLPLPKVMGLQISQAPEPAAHGGQRQDASRRRFYRIEAEQGAALRGRRLPRLRPRLPVRAARRRGARKSRRQERWSSARTARTSRRWRASVPRGASRAPS